MGIEELDLREHETLFESCKGDTWRTPQSIVSNQVSGRFYFTDQRIAFRTWGPFKKSAAYDIELSDIESLTKYSINIFIRTGIKVLLKDHSVYKISVLKRDKYLQYISNYL